MLGTCLRYLRALAAFYVRLTFDPPDVYKTLEPLLTDYRKLKRRTRTGYKLTFMDEFVEELLTKERVCSTTLWKLPARQQLEDLDLLEERISPLGAEIDEIDDDDDDRRLEREENGNGADREQQTVDNNEGNERDGRRSISDEETDG